MRYLISQNISTDNHTLDTYKEHNCLVFLLGVFQGRLGRIGFIGPTGSKGRPGPAGPPGPLGHKGIHGTTVRK